MGRVLTGEGRPTSEIRMHLLAYELRPDVSAVVHAHLPYATACTLAGIDLLEPILPEVVITLGGIPTAAYATPGTEEVPEAIRGIIQEYDALLLSRHGAMTVGRDVMDAYNKIEKAGTHRPGRPGGPPSGTADAIAPGGSGETAAIGGKV